MARKDPAVADIENRFAYHPATPETGPKHDAVRNDLKRLALKWNKDLPNGRHKAMALSSLQEAMWAANAAIACDAPDSPPAGEEPVAAPKTETKVDGRSKAARAAKATAKVPEAPAAEKPARRVARRARA